MPEEVKSEETKTPSAAEVQPPKADPPKPPAPPAKAEAGSAKEELAELDAETDEVPDADQLFKLSKKALAARLARHSKNELRTIFGTDDVEKIKADVAELATHRAEKEKTRLANLSEQERLKEEKEQEKRRADAAEAKLEAERDARIFSEYDGAAEKILGKYLDEEALELGLTKLKRHVMALDESDLKDTDKVFESFAKDYVKKHPKYAKGSEEERPAPVRVPLTTGGGGGKRPEASNPNLTQKTPKPGQVNSMTKAEYSAYKRQRGLSH